jgi:hypothetical protein
MRGSTGNTSIWTQGPQKIEQNSLRVGADRGGSVAPSGLASGQWCRDGLKRAGAAGVKAQDGPNSAVLLTSQWDSSSCLVAVVWRMALVFSASRAFECLRVSGSYPVPLFFRVQAGR